MIKNLFNNYLDNLDFFFELISNYYGVKLYERDTLFIFDEVQLFPRARSAIEYLIEDGRYDHIETGSLISIKKNVEYILIPSEEQHITLNPMDFEEFLWALGEDDLLKVKKSILDLYRDDINNHANGYKMKDKSLFDEIPSQLQKHNKIFQITLLLRMVWYQMKYIKIYYLIN